MQHKMAVYNSFVLPHFLYGSETWTCTETQLHQLEVAHSDCLHHILGVRRSDRHSLQHIHQACGSQPLQLMVVKRAFQWLGHVARMPDTRYPAMVHECVPMVRCSQAGSGDSLMPARRKPGRPKASFKHWHTMGLKRVGVQNPELFLTELNGVAQNRVAWRTMVKGWTLSKPNPVAPTMHTRSHTRRTAAR